MDQKERKKGTACAVDRPRSLPSPKRSSASANVRALKESSRSDPPNESGGSHSLHLPASMRVANGQGPIGEAKPRSLPPTDWKSGKDSVISIGIVDEHSFTRECITRWLEESGESLDTVPFASCEDCVQSSRNLDLILYHDRERVPGQYNNDDERLAPLKQLLKISPVIILSAVDSPDSILDAFENGARGYIPTASTTLELAREIIRLVRAGGTFVPPSSLSLRRIDRQSLTPAGIMISQLTPRQLAVLGHLKLGKANKSIAHALEMSESTVKVHIRNMMRKMKATNRTEVACRAYAIAASEK